MPLNVVENRQLLFIISMFMVVQFAGLLLASQVFAGASSASALVQAQGSGNSGGIAYLGFIIIAIVVFSALLVIIFRFIKTDKLFTLLEIWVVGFASLIFFLVIIGALTGNAFSTIFGSGPSPAAFAVAIACVVILIVAKFKWQRLRNITAMIASIGAGLVLGISFPFWFAFAFMAILAVYDFIAVFITKHMITLANAAMSKNLSLMITANEVEAVPMSYLSKKEMSEYSKVKKEIALKSPISKSVMDSGMVPLSARTALGTGDLMAPLMMAVAAYTVYFNFTLSLVVVVGSVLGLGLTMYVLKKYKRPLPAIPFLLFGICIALGISFLTRLI